MDEQITTWEIGYGRSDNRSINQRGTNRHSVSMLHPLRGHLDHLNSVLVHLLDCLRGNLQNHLLLVALPRLVSDRIEDLALNVLPNLLGRISPCCHPIEQLRVVAAKNDDDVEPAQREEIASVEVDDHAAVLAVHPLLDVVEQFVLIEDVRLQSLVELREEAVLSDLLRTLDLLESEFFCQRGC
ncbi:hypothetical protein PMAYCL1PPCAC_05759 [Pristionchus mayeri]|uniref:Uncharacterized protein n=1 Tax=Pristionchus mayeri TaxID=1317129 RepID=A0AAN4Z9G6_9BILA|nr:hypothetical protein PMAYCL1PPCAC_05759 [Pristionchus mayeri]